MNDPVPVRGVERVRDLDAEIQRLSEGERTGHEPVAERLPFDELHHDEVASRVLVDVVDRADVRVLERGGGARLTAQTLQRLRVVPHVVGQELQRDAPAELEVFGLVDDAHAAAAQLLEDPVVGDGLADHLVFAASRCARNRFWQSIPICRISANSAVPRTDASRGSLSIAGKAQ